MKLFSLRKEDGAYYPVIRLDEDKEAFRDDACGGYELRSEAVQEVKNAYGKDAKCVSLRVLEEKQQKGTQ